MIQQFHTLVYTQRNYKHSSKNLGTSVHSSTIHNNQKVEITQMPNHKWVDTESVVHKSEGVLLSLQKGIKFWHMLQQGWT